MRPCIGRIRRRQLLDQAHEVSSDQRGHGLVTIEYRAGEVSGEFALLVRVLRV